ncbi:DUF659 domain-containing protein [Aphis craccivora]|uniref:DUF659 domain-containing protein n=1 Tax=Aphis craccivora TaxID=307492 RepID=A0A6G0ZMB4_APHCR|nr:DUF659 domain-containing protein [Aphis craccivora]
MQYAIKAISNVDLYTSQFLKSRLFNIIYKKKKKNRESIKHSYFLVNHPLPCNTLLPKQSQIYIYVHTEDDKKYNIIIYISVNFRFMEDIIKQLETRKMTSFQNLGLIDEMLNFHYGINRTLLQTELTLRLRVPSIDINLYITAKIRAFDFDNFSKWYLIASRSRRISFFSVSYDI